MVEMLKRRDELKFGVLFINRPKVSYLIQWSDFNKNFSSTQIGYVKQGFESSHSGGIEWVASAPLPLRGRRGREHIFEIDGEHVTTVTNRSRNTHLYKSNRRPVTNAEFKIFEELRNGN